MPSYKQLAAILAGKSCSSNLATPEKVVSVLDVVKILPVSEPFRMADYCIGNFKPMNLTSTMKKYGLISKVCQSDLHHSGFLWTTTPKHKGLMEYLGDNP